METKWEPTRESPSPSTNLTINLMGQPKYYHKNRFFTQNGSFEIE
ncbi:hypothetical protein LEP1GSC060_0391 [Leptospira weilii serovar Ranarum str. ICFT]|uniref:Uncharacterized protein n=1 Tax=Leptospira weilii serovar Ranarum str. ICFT TaxID=1218598 RepID=N1WGW4_9LEPT|nr:hypothetical protein LEP1GSC060_0391 [Leptospira weilii serovar Ranarum str. ICFT]